MARLRTVMARSRTGLSFIRTGMSISAIGAGLLVTFGTSSPAWAALYLALVLTGGLFIADGLYWHLPAERMPEGVSLLLLPTWRSGPDYGQAQPDVGNGGYSVMMTSDTTAKRFLALSEKGLLSRERLKAAEQAAAARAWTRDRADPEFGVPKLALLQALADHYRCLLRGI